MTLKLPLLVTALLLSGCATTDLIMLVQQQDARIERLERALATHPRNITLLPATIH